MNEPIRMKNKGQINIVLNSKENVKIHDKIKRDIIVQDTTSSEHLALKEIETELGSLVGMEEMKKMVKEIYAWIYVNKKRELEGLKGGKQALHMMFKGNPGTGKTTVARLIGRLFQKMDMLSKGHLIEAERADLVGEYIGHTAQKTRDLVKKSMGGILFIDEAYSLGRGGEKDFGKEAIDTLVKHMEDKQHEFILILAGYSREMDHFLTLNPGLHSRFPLVFDFPDYSVDQLLQIGQQMLEDKEYSFTPEAQRKVREHLYHVKSMITAHNFSNGRYVRNVIEKSIRSQAMRLLMQNRYTRNDLLTLTSSDLVFPEDEKKERADY
ncbi:stage V sporulation protein K [Bacillus spongiae]|uniref:Stage V sporulation protein K n=1 Tax=Bacillus spongiae TaxID=2683610 RepID=A0ABU8HBQ8_9BACI